jgi:hypothetical protein
VLQHDHLSELQVLLPCQGAWHVYEEVWGRGASVGERLLEARINANNKAVSEDGSASDGDDSKHRRHRDYPSDITA